ncbi:hypothetical protein DBB29_10665 [Pandoraea cepalis]|uniref:Uncharacterized protein n=1 Tax=Pandoraea cepalis TaxID=2508294 RepID=A0AAW7MUN0_9BURK|nr:hypothetical protein [Pandoraea cepalis]MDN4578574.1 hypothetical protein [Pandoraea cepalis]
MRHVRRHHPLRVAARAWGIGTGGDVGRLARLTGHAGRVGRVGRVGRAGPAGFAGIDGTSDHGTMITSCRFR